MRNCSPPGRDDFEPCMRIRCIKFQLRCKLYIRAVVSNGIENMVKYVLEQTAGPEWLHQHHTTTARRCHTCKRQRSIEAEDGKLVSACRVDSRLDHKIASKKEVQWVSGMRR